MTYFQEVCLLCQVCLKIGKSLLPAFLCLGVVVWFINSHARAVRRG